jgi:small-conductance mechanosensitive channel
MAVVFVSVLYILAALLPGVAEAQEAATPPAEPAPVEQVDEGPVSDITVRSQEALAAIDRLRGEIDAMGDREAEAEQLEGLQGRVANLLPEGRTLEELLANRSAIDGVLVRSRSLSNQAGGLIDSLTSTAERLEQSLAEIRELGARWQRVQSESTDMPDALKERVADILQRIRELERLTGEKLNRTIELQNASMSVRNAITPIAERIESYGRDQQTQLFVQNVEPIWAMTGEHITVSSQQATQRITGSLQRDFLAWLETSEASIGAHLLLLPLLLILAFRLRNAAAEPPTGVLARPVPATVLVWMLIGIAIYSTSPAAFRMIYVITGMIVAGVVLYRFLPREIRSGVVVFIVIAVVERVLENLAVTDPAPRLAYLVLTAGLLVLAVLGRTRGGLRAMTEWGAPRPFVNGVVFTAVALLLISVVTNVVGYVQLSRLLMAGVIDSFSVFLILFAGLTSISEIIEAVLNLRSLDNFRSIAHNRYRLKRALRMPLVWLSLLLWGWATAWGFGIDIWLLNTLRGVFLAEMSIGEVTLSLRGILVFVFAVWAAVWASRIVRALLNQDVLPRMDLPRGVPNTISMTAHYSIILIGLLLGVGFMGIDLSNLAFVVGALGVGIGFGLQNLVNNFVSGLILIFEAPIQVGDTVEVGNLIGRVTQIGIRTSRVKTYGGSEVIVPNGDLVSNQVINWTLSDRHRRLELVVGVAYGSDPERVTEILRGVVDAEPDVLEDPAPTILFQEFGDSALNFRVMAWIADFDTGFSMIHKLNVAINRALAENGISIPFPQRDLHVKTLPDGFQAGPATS